MEAKVGEMGRGNAEKRAVGFPHNSRITYRQTQIYSNPGFPCIGHRRWRNHGTELAERNIDGGRQTSMIDGGSERAVPEFVFSGSPDSGVWAPQQPHSIGYNAEEVRNCDPRDWIGSESLGVPFLSVRLPNIGYPRLATGWIILGVAIFPIIPFPPGIW